MSGRSLIFSWKRSFLFRKRITEVSKNHLLLRMELKRRKASSMRFCQRRRGQESQPLSYVSSSYLSMYMSPSINFPFLSFLFPPTYHRSIFSQAKVIRRQSYKEQDGRHVLETMDPFFSLTPLATYVDDPASKESKAIHVKLYTKPHIHCTLCACVCVGEKE